MIFNPSLTYESALPLFYEHSATNPIEYAREAYERTSCGVWTSFLLADGSSIASSHLTLTQNTMTYAIQNFIGVQHGTIVEGSDAEFSADPLLFPFTDEELAEAWDYLEERAADFDDDCDDDCDDDQPESAND